MCNYPLLDIQTTDFGGFRVPSAAQGLRKMLNLYTEEKSEAWRGLFMIVGVLGFLQRSEYSYLL